MTELEVKSKEWVLLKDFNGEEWRQIPGYGDRYLVSNYGRIKSIGIKNRFICKSDRILRGSYNKLRYKRVVLAYGGKKHTTVVHRLVAMAFLPNPQNLPCINHKDENPSNNHVDNLEWCTHKYNINYGNCRKRISIGITNHPNLTKPIAQYDMDGNFIQRFQSVRDAKRILKLKGFKGIYDTCVGKNNFTHYGYQWKYINDDQDYTKNIGRAKIKYSTNKKRVFQYDMNMNFIKEYESANSAAKATGCKSGGILKCCKKKWSSTHGYKWFFEKQKERE